MKKRSLPFLLVLFAALLSFGCQGKEDAAPKPEETAQISLEPEPDGDDAAVAADDLEFPSDSNSRERVVITADDDAGEESEEAIEFLDVGDPAPALEIASWVKGDEVGGFDDGQVYVVEFWATWCGPCKASMPHLAELQEKYGEEVVFVGVSDEIPETVEAFLETQQSEDKTWDEVVSYRLAMDAEERTTQSYMRAAGESGIPTAFVVGRQGTIEWIGHPMGIDQPLSDIVADTWDADAFLAKRTNAKQAERERMAAMSKINTFVQDEDWDGAVGVIDELLESFGSDTNLLVTKFELLWRSERIDEAYAFADELAESNWDNHRFLNGFAWAIATEVPEHARNLEAALRYALRSNELTDDGDGSVLDTVARVHYELENLAEAVAWQEKAVAAEPGVKALEKALEKYRAELAAANADPSDGDSADAEDDVADVEADGEAAGGAGLY